MLSLRFCWLSCCLSFCGDCIVKLSGFLCCGWVLMVVFCRCELWANLLPIYNVFNPNCYFPFHNSFLSRFFFLFIITMGNIYIYILLFDHFFFFALLIFPWLSYFYFSFSLFVAIINSKLLVLLLTLIKQF